MKVVIFSLLSLGFALFSCGSDEKTTTPAPTATKSPAPDTGGGGDSLTYKDVSSIISSKCGGCHPASAPDFSTLDKVKSYGASKLAGVLGVTMPKGSQTGFKESTDGAKLYKWLTTGSDIK